jgi:hypothetical protein
VLVAALLSLAGQFHAGAPVNSGGEPPSKAFDV